MDETYETEWQWFRRSIRDSIVRPRRFAASLAREHYGLAGVLVALLAGMGFSIAVDAALVSGKGLDPSAHVTRIVTDAFLLGLRIAIVAALMSIGVLGVSRLLRRTSISLDQSFTAVAFALAPLLIAPLLALVLVVLPQTFPAVAALVVLLALRLLYGLIENLRHLIPIGVALAAALAVVASVPFVLADQVSRVEFVALGYAPQLAPELRAPPVTGDSYIFKGDGYELTLPMRWKSVPLGLPGQIGRFETATDLLIVLRISGNAFVTPDGFADTAGVPWRRGLTETGGWLLSFGSSSRAIEYSRGQVLVDDIFRGTVDGRSELLRQVTAAGATRGLALQFRYIQPPEEQRALDESAAIAASWRVLAK